MEQINRQVDFPMEVISDQELRRRFAPEIKQQHEEVTPKKIARGRGNQGDWENNRKATGELEHHKAHNAEVERRKLEKALRKAERRHARA